MLQEIDTALCLHKMAMFPDSAVAIPSNIVPYTNVTFGWDNIDRLEETLSGVGTSHRVNGLIVQRKIYGPFLPPCTPVPVIPKLGQKSISFDDQPLPLYNAGNRVGPLPRILKDLDHNECKTESWRNSLLWILCRLHLSTNQTIASWTGFNIMSNSSNVMEDNTGYLPTRNTPATNMSTVHEVLVQSTQIMDSLHLQSIVCVFDQALYAKAAEIKWKHMDSFGRVVLRMGAFHTTCCLLSILGKRFANAGLRDIIIETGIIAEGSVSAVLDGRMYNRAVRCHKLLYEALLRITWKGFIPWISSVHPEKRTLIHKLEPFIEELCDTVSSFAGKGKLSAFQLVKKNISFQELFASPGSSVMQTLRNYRCLLAHCMVPKSLSLMSTLSGTNCSAPNKQTLKGTSFLLVLTACTRIVSVSVTKQLFGKEHWMLSLKFQVRLE